MWWDIILNETGTILLEKNDVSIMYCPQVQ